MSVTWELNICQRADLQREGEDTNPWQVMFTFSAVGEPVVEMASLWDSQTDAQRAVKTMGSLLTALDRAGMLRAPA